MFLPKGKRVLINIEMEHKNPFENHESKSLFSRTLIEVLGKYNTNIHVLSKEANLSPKYKRQLLNDEELTPPPNKLLKKITKTLVGRIQPRDVIDIVVSAIFSEEFYKDVKNYLEGLGYVENLNDFQAVLDNA